MKRFFIFLMLASLAFGAQAPLSVNQNYQINYGFTGQTGQTFNFTNSNVIWPFPVNTIIPNLPINVKSFGATGNGTTDDTAAINSALAFVAAQGPFAGGTLYMPVGTYKTTSTIVIPSFVTIQGDGGKGDGPFLTAPSPTIIHGTHNGIAVLSLVGSYCVHLKDIEVYGDQTTTPKTGILMGRFTNLASAGTHTLDNIGVTGYYSVAGVYSIASEDNYWNNDLIILDGGGAVHAFYTSQTDELGIGGLGGASNEADYYGNLSVVNYVSNSSADCIYMDTGSNTRGHIFSGGYFASMAGNYVTIVLGLTDLASTPGPITFDGTSGELLTSSTTANGFRIIDSGGSGYTLNGLAILGSRFTTASGGKFIDQDSTCTISGSIIHCPSSNNASSWGKLNRTYADVGYGFVPGGSVFFGSRIRQGTATLSSGTATVTDTAVASGTEIFLADVTPGGTVGAIFISAKTASTSFVITSTSNTDSSVVAYTEIDP